MIYKNNILEWYNKKTKLKKISDLCELNKYIDYYNLKNNLTKNTSIISYSYDYLFEFYNVDKMNFEDMKIRPENVFKLNFLIILKKMKKYFDKINFPGLKLTVDFGKASFIDIVKKIPQATYKHDVYIRIEYSDDKDYVEREIGLEYFEIQHDRIKDQEKKISSEIQLETYLVYEEKDCKYEEFMKKAIYEIFLNISCVLNDKYILTKIIYFQNYIQNKNIKQDTLIFNKILEWKKNNKFNFEDFFESLPIINPDNDKPFDDYLDFKKYFEDNYGIKIIIDNNKCCKFNYFEEIINRIDLDTCRKIYDYRKTFTNMMNIMLDASDKIILMSNEKSRLIKHNLPAYLDNLPIHIQNWKNKTLVKNIYNAIGKKLK